MVVVHLCVVPFQGLLTVTVSIWLVGKYRWLEKNGCEGKIS